MASEDPVVEADADEDDRVPPHDHPGGSNESSVHVGVDAAANELGRADLLLQLRELRERLDALADEKDRLHDDMAALREEHFEAREELELQAQELEHLRASFEKLAAELG